MAYLRKFNREKRIFVTNIWFNGQNIHLMEDIFDIKVKSLLPANIVYVLSAEVYSSGPENIEDFGEQVKLFIDNIYKGIPDDVLILFYEFNDYRNNDENFQVYYKKLKKLFMIIKQINRILC